MSGQQWVATILLVEVFINIVVFAFFEPRDQKDWAMGAVGLHLVLLGFAVLVGLFGIATGGWVIG